tara:strand:- start:908 stop:2608 length:1701 start_codon:yes stop_codon:yes gene_type:complete
MIKWQEHPVLKPPTAAQLAKMDPQKVLTLHQQFHSAIRNAADDPLNCGFSMPHWDTADSLVSGEGATNELIVLGGNRSGKTVYGARSIIKAATENPGSLIFAFSQNAEVSIRQVQKTVYEWLPPEYRKTSRSKSHYISYKRATGFAGSSLIFPNDSQIVFKHYTQFQQDQSILEGAELGSFEESFVNWGVWLDEYLLGPELVDTLRFRLATRNSKMLLTYTPLTGYTNFIREYLHQAETLEEKPAELLDNELVPFVQRSKNRDAHVVYFHSVENPFGGYERIRQDLANSSRDNILTRAYGIPVRSSATVFPLFSREVNVVSPEQIPQENVTRYFLCDPGGAKNWFCTWVSVTADGTWFVYREFPADEAWVEHREGKWRPGPGARGRGLGIRDFVKLFYTLEGGQVTEHEDGRITTDTTEKGETIYERIIDPRMSQIQTPSARGGVESIQSNLDDLDFITHASLIVKGAQGTEIEQGIQALNNLMAYDRSMPIDAANRPHFYVSTECENVIHSLGEYTLEAGLRDPNKDPIDCLRYGATTGIYHMDEQSLLQQQYQQNAMPSYGAPR